MTAGNIEILLVEDDPNDAELIRRVLKKHDAAERLLCLKDGAEALDYLLARGGRAHAAESLRVVLLDLKLPKVDGIEVLRQVKADQRTRHIPVVVLTSSTEHRDLTAAYDLGVNSYIAKPINFEEFTRVVSELGLYWLKMNRSFSR